ncbi:MAG: DUF4190 domain-containing protein [Planctomycetes bacterium]|nr:DUF4190 domain-containing protein [Planctomycetota bacterium]
MADYYIDTGAGPRGPYSEEQIIAGVTSGKIPTGARIRDAATNEVRRAVDLTARPQDSSSYSPPAEYRAQGQHQNLYRQPVPGPQPMQGQYPQQQYQQYPPQQQYPQQQAYGYQQPYGNAGMPYGQQYQYPVARQTSTLAIVSLVLSCVSILVCTLLAVGGIICGILALKECEPNGDKKGRGLAWAGIGVGIAMLVLTVAVIALMVAAGEM